MSGDFHPGNLSFTHGALAPALRQVPAEYQMPVPMQMLPRAADRPNAIRDASSMLLRYWKLILACTLLALLAVPLILAFVAPVYEADALVQLEVGDKGPSRAPTGDMFPVTEQSAPVTAEIELLKSRLILGTVVDRMRLDLIARPHFMPGPTAWQEARPVWLETLRALRLPVDRFAWGPSQIVVDQLDLPPGLMSRPLVLRSRPGGEYTLFDEKRVLLTGSMGVRAHASLPEGEIAMTVASLVGAPGTPYDVALMSRDDSVREFLKNFRATEQGKDSGLVRVTYRGEDPASAARAVNVAIEQYREKDVQWRTAKASRTLDFLKGQMPALKLRVESAEAALTRHKLANNAPDLATETALVLQQSVGAEDSLQRLRQQRADLQQRFTSKHPSMLAVDAQIAQASAMKTQIDGRIRTLPGSQRELATRTRDLEVAMRLYVAMLEESQQLDVAKSGTIGAVRIVDEAVAPSLPVFPLPGIVLAAALIFGLVGGAFLASLMNAVRNRVESVADLEDAIGPCCLATIRYSPLQRSVERAAARRGAGKPAAILALAHRGDRALDGIRALRAAILTDRLTIDGGVILVAGLAPGVGRGFVLTNLAISLMGTAQRVVVVDADPDGRGLGRYFVARDAGGMTDWLCRACNCVEDVVETGEDGYPDFVPAGRYVGPSLAMLEPQRVRSLLVELRRRYDYVLVNAPPLSAFGDGLVVAKSVDAVVLVGCQFQHRSSEVSDLTQRLVRAGVPFIGAVLNRMRSSDRLGYLGSASRA